MMQNPASSSTTLTVLTLAFLFKGLRSQNSNFNLTVPAAVSVPRGLCVHIPCSFTYDEGHRPNPAKLWGYWLINKDGDRHFFAHNSYRSSPGILVATNDEKQRLSKYVVNRFNLTGEPEEGDCSFSILHAKPQDAGEYYFRIEDNVLRYNYPQRAQVAVTELEKPQVWAASAVLSGKEAVYTCSAPGPCFKTEPVILWKTILTGHGTTQWSQHHTNGSWTYGSNFTFMPSLNDQGKKLTCQVWYPGILTLVEESIQLVVADPPKTVDISTNATDRKHLALCSPEAQGALESAVAQDGESITLRCKAESTPDPTLSWMREGKTLESTKKGKEHVLLLSNVRPEDAGEYQCRAETPHGSATKSLQLCVLSTHNGVWGSSAIFLIILCLIKVVFCFLFFFSVIGFSNWRKAPLKEK